MSVKCIKCGQIITIDKDNKCSGCGYSYQKSPSNMFLFGIDSSVAKELHQKEKKVEKPSVVSANIANEKILYSTAKEPDRQHYYVQNAENTSTVKKDTVSQKESVEKKTDSVTKIEESDQNDNISKTEMLIGGAVILGGGIGWFLTFFWLIDYKYKLPNTSDENYWITKLVVIGISYIFCLVVERFSIVERISRKIPDDRKEEIAGSFFLFGCILLFIFGPLAYKEDVRRTEKADTTLITEESEYNKALEYKYRLVSNSENAFTWFACINGEGKVLYSNDFAKEYLTGSYQYQEEVATWKNLRKIEVSSSPVLLADVCVVGLTNNNEILVASDLDVCKKAEEWKDVVDISCGAGIIVGLMSDGTVKTIEWVDYSSSYVNGIDEWNDIKEITVGSTVVAGLKSDGTVVTNNNCFGDQDYDIDTSSWKKIVHIYSAKHCIYGLTSDGKVVAVGENKHKECNTKKWKDIVDVECTAGYVLGLKSDGTVVATGDNTYGQCNVEDWTDIVQVSACAREGLGTDDADYSRAHTLGLKSDGTVLSIGENINGCCETDEWKNIVAVHAGTEYIYGVDEDGFIITNDTPFLYKRIN